MPTSQRSTDATVHAGVLCVSEDNGPAYPGVRPAVSSMPAMWGPPLVPWAASRDSTRSVRSWLVSTSARAGCLPSKCSSSSCTFWLPTEYCSRQAQQGLSMVSAASYMELAMSACGAAGGCCLVSLEHLGTVWSMLGQGGACLDSVKHAAWTVQSMHRDSLEHAWTVRSMLGQCGAPLEHAGHHCDRCCS